MTSSSHLATDRAALMLQLVPYLIGQGEVTVADAARDFEVTPAEMRAMVEKITVIGLPGDGGFWQMANDLFDIDWDLLDTHDTISITNAVGLERAPRLTAREAAALLTGLQLAASLPGVGDSGVVNGLLAKLARVGGQAPAEVIVAPSAVDEVRTSVADAVRRGVAVSFTYRAPDTAPTTRTVDPIKVSIANGQWYLQGWCHMRQAMRTFHLDRVSDPVLTEIPSSHAAAPVPELFEPVEGDAVVEIRFPASAATLVATQLSTVTFSGSGAWRTARVRVGDARSLKRLAARLGGIVEIVSPPEAREAAREWCRVAIGMYAPTSRSRGLD